jgi:hypothetical protein
MAIDPLQAFRKQEKGIPEVGRLESGRIRDIAAYI